MPRLRVHDIYAGALKAHKGEGSQALSQRLQEARWFIKNIQQRFSTRSLRVSNAIVERQKNFSCTANWRCARWCCGANRRTNSACTSRPSARVTTAKYMATPYGNGELKYFFGSALGTETGGNASSTAVRALIKQFVTEREHQEAAVGQPDLGDAERAGDRVRAADGGEIPRGAADRAGESAQGALRGAELPASGHGTPGSTRDSSWSAAAQQEGWGHGHLVSTVGYNAVAL